MKISRLLFCLTLIVTLLLVLASCNFPGSDPGGTPTMNVTQAYQTVEARLTQAIAQTPTPLPPTATEASSPTVTPTRAPTTAVSTATFPTRTATAQRKCDLAAAGAPIDVSVPDNTQMQPGENFTKIWRLQNAGTCTWTQNYSVALFSGESMGAPASVPFPNSVSPGESIDINVAMVAPQEEGSYQGNWMLRNEANEWFGIGDGSAAFWVKIIVGTSQAPTSTVTIPISPTITASVPTETEQSNIKVSGSSLLPPGSQLDLDTNTINSGTGDDLAYDLNEDGLHILFPSGSTLIDVFGASRPTVTDCQSASLDSQPLVIENVSPDAYMCYRTDQGLYGWANISARNAEDNSITVQILTWSGP